MKEKSEKETSPVLTKIIVVILIIIFLVSVIGLIVRFSSNRISAEDKLVNNYLSCVGDCSNLKTSEFVLSCLQENCLLDFINGYKKLGYSQDTFLLDSGFSSKLTSKNKELVTCLSSCDSNYCAYTCLKNRGVDINLDNLINLDN